MASITIFGIIGVGLYFLIKLRAFFLFHPIRTLRLFWQGQKTGKRESFRTLSLALAGTLGVGNVTGVAFCLLRGGAGSVFWMLLSALFAAALKYAESVVTVADREKENRKEGGMPYVIRNSYQAGGILSVLYAVLCLVTAFTMGSALQTRAITETAKTVYAVPLFPISLLVCLLSLFLIRKGKHGIMRAGEILVPLATFLYTALCIFVLFQNRAQLPAVLLSVVCDAFSPVCAAYGTFGFALIFEVTKRAYVGIAAGLLSNESGAGTSTLAHGGNLSTSPTSEGILGTFEILVDTVFLCTLTALTLLSGGLLSVSHTAMELVVFTFDRSVGGAFRLPFFLSVFIFALATVICWFSYGEICRSFLFGEKGKTVYLFLYTAAAFFGGFIPSEILIPLSDTFLSVLSFLTLATLLKNRKIVLFLTQKDGFLKMQKNRKIPLTKRKE